MTCLRYLALVPVALGCSLAPQAASSQTSAPAAPAPQSSDAADLAKKLSNPIADLISLPFQLNYNQGFASGDGDQWTLNVQPVIPFSISANWNVISRTIVPIVSQDGVIPGAGSQFGLSATTQSLFFSPKATTAGGIVWGVGPVFLLPTATDGIATNQWGAGLTGVALRQKDGWTIGGLANHIWSLTGDSEDGNISATFLQPFVSYTTPKATSFTLNTELTYDWETEEWSVPINAQVAQVVKIGARPVQFSLGARYYAKSAEFGPDGWGARAQVTLLFPK